MRRWMVIGRVCAVGRYFRLSFIVLYYGEEDAVLIGWYFDREHKFNTQCFPNPVMGALCS